MVLMANNSMGLKHMIESVRRQRKARRLSINKKVKILVMNQQEEIP